MHKRYYPNMIINDSHLSFVIQITKTLRVYYKKYGSDTLYRADSIYHKKTGHLNISIDDYNIICTGVDKDKNIIYKIYHKGVEIENDKTNKQPNKPTKTET